MAEALTQYKLIVLYMLDHVDFPLTNTQISNFVLEKEYTTYFTIQQAISELCKGKTLLVIAHRLNTIRHANQIFVVAEGQIVQRGVHKELMREEGIYRKFVSVRENSQGWNSRSA